MNKILSYTVTRKMHTLVIPTVMRTGDFDAYILRLMLPDMTLIGDVRFRFRRSDGADYITEPIPINGNTIEYTLSSVDLACPSPLQAWLQISDNNLMTPLRISFTGIEVMPSGTPLPETNEYPELLKRIDEAKTATESATASATYATTQGSYALHAANEAYQNRYPFSGKIICGSCGGTFKRQTHTNSRYKYAWCCKTHITDKDKCSIQYITEAAFEAAFVTMKNKLIFGHKEILRPLLEDIRGRNSDDTLISIRTLDEKLEENAEQRKVLIGLMTKGYLERPVYAKSNNELLQEAERLQYRKTSLLRFLSSDQLHVSEVSELLLFASKADMLTSFDAVLFERFVDRIIVYSRTEIGFVLKCGITLRERSVT